MNLLTSFLNTEETPLRIFSAKYVRRPMSEAVTLMATPINLIVRVHDISAGGSGRPPTMLVYSSTQSRKRSVYTCT